MKRLFFAAWPPDSWRRELSSAVAPALAGLRGRMQSGADWHLTLCFLGNVDERLLGPLCQRAGDIRLPAFTVVFDCLRYWREPRVLVATLSRYVAPESAVGLVRALTSTAIALGVQPDARPWLPHLTLARGVSPEVWAEQASSGELPLPAVQWSVDAFHLAESRVVDGRRYQLLASWPLRAGGQ